MAAMTFQNRNFSIPHSVEAAHQLSASCSSLRNNSELKRRRPNGFGWARSSVLVMLLSATIGASATNYTLWVNGRNGGGVPGNYNDFGYWGTASVNAGVNKKAVNWDGRNRISTQMSRLINALDCFCTGTNWCYVAAHSAGNLMVGYVLDLHGGTNRYKKTPMPRSDGQCTNSDGKTQKGWNIKWVGVAGGAAGGSEIADIGNLVPLDYDLKTITARSLYNHNNTRGTMFYLFAGAKGSVFSMLLPGQDDSWVAYHSSGGVAGTSSAAYCNLADWLCNDLTLGTAPTQNGKPKWTNHSVLLRDDGVLYNHGPNGNWGGIVAPLRSHMQANAK
ncbi:hypothetical protein [Azohydromonas lata]|uniref:Uncharacterized protein n=1 Tax=Azohydromonas lata TaxID=45677 RepID=A0ABU5INV1_9BURK|nr:hypothetical protein [Azohydromonas lata]MDZ5460583.1 hypothetical protein [Azohydromonas lata]